jgi:hypothetical protein
MNLFSKPKAQAPATPPSIDEAQQRVETQRRGRGMRGRAATMLTNGAAQAGARQTTGN